MLLQSFLIKHKTGLCAGAFLLVSILLPVFPAVSHSKTDSAGTTFKVEKTAEFINLVYTGTELHKKGKLDRALEKYNLALEIAPASEMVLLCMGKLYLQKGNQERAFEIYREVLEKTGDKSSIISARTALGVIYMDRGEYEKAIDEFRECLHLDPESKKAVLYRTKINRCKSEL